MLGFDDSGDRVPSVDFPFDEIDEDAPGPPPPAICDAVDHPNRRDRGEMLVLREMLEWIIQKVPKNNDGIEIRATIVCWIFLPYLRSKSMTEIAAMIGRDKQSLGRWVDNFKKKWPSVHLRE